MGLVIDEKLYGELLKKNLPRKISTGGEYDHWAAILEQIDFASRFGVS